MVLFDRARNQVQYKYITEVVDYIVMPGMSK